MCKTTERLRERERERERESEGEQIAANRGSVSCKNGHWKNRPFWDKPGLK